MYDNKRLYSLLYRLYRRGAGTRTDSMLSHFYEDKPKAIQTLKRFYFIDEYEAFKEVWTLRTPPSTLGLSHNGQGYYAAKGSRSCLLDFYSHNGVKLVRTGWLRPKDLV